MSDPQNPVQIMTSIAYVNGAPHVGYALELLQADVYARYYRMRGHPVYFLTGTDEHGSKIFKSAKEAGKDTQDFVDENAAKFQSLAQAFQISNDDFIRTTDRKRHWPAVTKLWNILKEEGLLEKHTYEGLYCEGCESFKTEKDLIDGKCPDHLTRTMQRVSEENYFFLLSKFNDQVKEVIEKRILNILPQHRANEMLSLTKSGLLDVSFSRSKQSLPWGIPVPGDEEQVMYVWCDALTNYISAVGYADNTAVYQQFWGNPEAKRMHFVGKDIQRFHATIWPGMLLAAKIPVPTDIYVHGYISLNGERMSKSSGTSADPFDYINEFGVDALRYYLAREIPSSEDGDFNRERFIELYNGELANNLGNLVQRVVAMALKNELIVQSDAPVLPSVAEFDRELDECFAKFEIHHAMGTLMKHFKLFNQWIDEKKPWEMAKTDKAAVVVTLSTILNTLKAMVPYVEIFLPETAKKMKAKLGLDENGQGNVVPQITEGLFMRK